MKKKLKDLSQNELTELMDLMSRINILINKDFLHVKDCLPKSVTITLVEYDEDLYKEFERREDES